MPAIDSVRTIALIVIMVYHFRTEWIPGAYFSIDLFFVLSGFLITSLLLKEHDTNNSVSLTGFWGRRIRRLLPAAATVIIAVAIWSRIIGDPIVSQQVRSDGIAAIFYSLNIKYVISGASYFESFLSPSPFRHMWTLSLEEQWYLIWPLAAWWLLKRGGVDAAKRAVPVLMALAVAAAVWMAIVVEGTSDPSRAYYGSDTRSQALLIGAASAIWAHGRHLDRGRNRRRLDVLGVVSALICTAMIVFATEKDLVWYRGGFFVFSFCGAIVIVNVAQRTPGILHRVLDHRPLRWLGRMSYGIYLWHWPVDVAFKRFEIRDELPISGPGLFLVQSLVALALAIASFKLIETPFRLGNFRIARPATLAFGSMALTLILLLGLTKPQRAVDLDLAESSSSAPMDGLSLPALDREPEEVTPGPRTISGDARILFVGDSSAWVMAGAIRPVGFDLLDGSLPGCGVDPAPIWVNGRVLERQGNCDQWHTRWTLGAALDPDVIVVSQGFHSTFDQQVDGRRVVVGSEEWKERYRAKLQSGIDALKGGGVRIVLLTYPCSIWRGTQTDGEEGDPIRVGLVNNVINEVAADNPGWVATIDWGNFMCPDGKFLEQLGGVEMRPDGTHLSTASAPIAFRWLMPLVMSAAQRPVL